MDSTKTILQIPLDVKLKDASLKAAKDQGFSSLQEAVRVFLSQLADKTISLKFSGKPIQLSPEAIKRYNKMAKDIESGKEEMFTADSVDELMAHLEA